MPAFIRPLLYLFSGAIFWALHFVAIYGFTGIICARGWQNQHWLEINLLIWSIGGLTAILVLATAWTMRNVLRQSFPEIEAPATRQFIRWCTVTLGLLAILAMIWEAIPVLVLEHCG